MNLDENKRYAIDYNQRTLLRNFDEIIGHHQYTQHVTEATWERVIENQVKSLIIDHIYCTISTSVEKVTCVDTSYGDHKLVLLKILNEAKVQLIATLRRNWNNSPELLMDELQKVEWQTGIKNIQELWNLIEQEIIMVIDKMVHQEEINTFVNRGKNSAMVKRKLNRRNYLLKKRKRSAQKGEEVEELADLNININNFYYEERK
jgi:hypothetical protein